MLSIRFILVIAVALSAALAAAAQEVLIGERDIARPGGSYVTLAVADAAACASLCGRDGLCLAWTHRAAGMCELKAVTPPPVATLGARSGLSQRAPDFARRLPLPELAHAEPPAATIAAAEPPMRSEVALLGGPDPEDEWLRPRLGGGP